MPRAVGLALARVRLGPQQQSLRGQGGDRTAGCAACLLLPHADALRLAHARFLFQTKGTKSLALGPLAGAAARWDRATADGVTHFIANSKVVQQRIRDCYGRASEVIHPPVDTDYYSPAPLPRENFYLVMSAFAPYKRLDLAIEACNLLKRPLVIIGTGQDDRKLRQLAGPTVRFLGWQADDSVRDHMRRCRALCFPARKILASSQSKRKHAAHP